MTISIEVKNVSLEYRVSKKLSLALNWASKYNGGVIRSKTREKHVVLALNDISFTLKSGDQLGLIGSNGAAKTILSKALYGIYTPISETLSVTGRIDALFNIRLGFRPEASGRKNIVFRGLINGWTENKINMRIDDIIEFSERGDVLISR